MQTIIVKLHYWELNCEDDLAEITLPDDVNMRDFRFELEDELGELPYDDDNDDLLDVSYDTLEKIVNKYNGSWRWIGFDLEIDVRWSEESEEEE